MRVWGDIETNTIAPSKAGYRMRSADREFIERLKPIIRQIPGAQELNKIRHKILRVRELQALVKEDKVVAFPSHTKLANSAAWAGQLAKVVAKEWLDLYGVVQLRRTTTDTMHFPAQGLLLYAPMALMEIPASHEEYLRSVERETRREIRLAAKQGYEFSEFVWNDYLGDIYEINISKEMRQSEPMRGWYRDPVQPRYHSREELQYLRYYGAFKGGKLYAYFHFWICGDMGVGKHILGHAQHLKNGIMNGLISYSVQECARNSQIQWLCYGDHNEGSSLESFKRHAGFQGYAILLDLAWDPELLRYSGQKVRTIWRL